MARDRRAPRASLGGDRLYRTVSGPATAAARERAGATIVQCSALPLRGPCS